MIELPVSDLRADDIGLRVIILSDGGTFEGTLDSLWVGWWQYAKPVPGPIVRSLEVHNENAELKLTSLPMDFRLQIDRPFKMDLGLINEAGNRITDL